MPFAFDSFRALHSFILLVQGDDSLLPFTCDTYKKASADWWNLGWNKDPQIHQPFKRYLHRSRILKRLTMEDEPDILSLLLSKPDQTSQHLFLSLTKETSSWSCYLLSRYNSLTLYFSSWWCITVWDTSPDIQFLAPKVQMFKMLTGFKMWTVFIPSITGTQDLKS